MFETAASLGQAATAYQVDVSQYDQVAQMAEQVMAQFGRLDILVNNAGIARMIPVNNMDDALRDLHYQVTNYRKSSHLRRNFLVTKKGRRKPSPPKEDGKEKKHLSGSWSDHNGYF